MPNIFIISRRRQNDALHPGASHNAAQPLRARRRAARGALMTLHVRRQSPALFRIAHVFADSRVFPLNRMGIGLPLQNAGLFEHFHHGKHVGRFPRNVLWVGRGSEGKHDCTRMSFRR